VLLPQVMGGSGDYFADADTIIVMDNYTPSDQTTAAHSIAAQHAAMLAAAGAAAAAAQQPPAAGGAGVWVTPRVPLRVYSGGADDFRGVKTHVRGLHHIQVCVRVCVCGGGSCVCVRLCVWKRGGG